MNFGDTLAARRKASGGPQFKRNIKPYLAKFTIRRRYSFWNKENGPCYVGILYICTVLVLRMAQRKWKYTKQHPGTAGPCNMLGSDHFFLLPVGHSEHEHCSCKLRLGGKFQAEISMLHADHAKKESECGQ